MDVNRWASHVTRDSQALLGNDFLERDHLNDVVKLIPGDVPGEVPYLEQVEGCSFVFGQLLIRRCLHTVEFLTAEPLNVRASL